MCTLLIDKIVSHVIDKKMYYVLINLKNLYSDCLQFQTLCAGHYLHLNILFTLNLQIIRLYVIY